MHSELTSSEMKTACTNARRYLAGSVQKPGQTAMESFLESDAEEELPVTPKTPTPVIVPTGRMTQLLRYDVVAGFQEVGRRENEGSVHGTAGGSRCGKVPPRREGQGRANRLVHHHI